MLTYPQLVGPFSAYLTAGPHLASPDPPPSPRCVAAGVPLPQRISEAMLLLCSR